MRLPFSYLSLTFKIIIYFAQTDHICKLMKPSPESFLKCHFLTYSVYNKYLFFITPSPLLNFKIKPALSMQTGATSQNYTYINNTN